MIIHDIVHVHQGLVHVMYITAGFHLVDGMQRSTPFPSNVREKGGRREINVMEIIKSEMMIA